jgi:c-di-GMP-binding flagellar brake protein YcgR
VWIKRYFRGDLSVVVSISGAMRINKLFIGKKVELSWEGELTGYLAAVNNFVNDKMMVKLLGDFEIEGKAEKVFVRFTVPDDASYEFTGSVVSYHEQSRSLLLEDLSPLTRIEQRRSYRLKILRPALIFLEDDTGSEKWLEGVLLDISKTGAKLLCSSSVKPGDSIKLHLSLDEVEHTLETEAEVIHVIEDDGQVKLGVKFAPLPLKDVELLLDLIYKLWEEHKKSNPE